MVSDDAMVLRNESLYSVLVGPWSRRRLEVGRECYWAGVGDLAASCGPAKPHVPARDP